MIQWMNSVNISVQWIQFGEPSPLYPALGTWILRKLIVEEIGWVSLFQLSRIVQDNITYIICDNIMISTVITNLSVNDKPVIIVFLSVTSTRMRPVLCKNLKTLRDGRDGFVNFDLWQQCWVYPTVLRLAQLITNRFFIRSSANSFPSDSIWTLNYVIGKRISLNGQFETGTGRISQQSAEEQTQQWTRAHPQGVQEAS